MTGRGEERRPAGRASAADRAKGLVIAAVVQAALVYGLYLGLSVRMPVPADHDLKLFAVLPAPLPPIEKMVPPKVRSKRPQGAAAPPNLKAQATEVVAPPQTLPLPVPQPIPAASTPALGSASWFGNAAVAGPGTGSGGQGNGTGSGGEGEGDGGGGEDDTPPRWLKGRLKDSDFPDSAAETGISGTVSVRYTVATSGRVTECSVTRSSGSPELDEVTCRLIKQRFRYRPSLDAMGRPVPSIIVENHSWLNNSHGDPDR